MSESPNRFPDVLGEEAMGYPLPPPRVLVVDDEPMIAKSIQELLTTRTNYRVILSAGGHDALAKIEASLYAPEDGIDLVLLDIMMPVVSGLDVLQWIRQHPGLETLRVVMLTGNDDKPNMINALSQGADDYITKPYHSQELLARMSTILRTQRLEKQLHRQSRQLAMLHLVGTRITKSLEVQDLLQQGVQGAQKLLDVETACVYMHVQTDRVLRCRVVASDDRRSLSAEAFPDIVEGNGVISLAYLNRATHCVNEVTVDKRFVDQVDQPPTYKVRNLVVSPIFLRGHPAGVFVAMNKNSGSFSHSDVDLFVSLSGTISQAIDNAYLFRTLNQRQKELYESAKTLQALIDGILYPIYTINNRWELVSINKTKADEEKIEGENLLGEVCYRAFFKRDQPCEHCQAAKIMAQQAPRRWTVRWVGTDYLPQEWDVNAYPIPNYKGNEARAVIFWQDRTEERRMENSLHQAAKLSAIGQLAAGVAHEINNPLTVITTGAEMLKEIISKDSAEDYEVVEWISKAANRATKVVRGLLDFARQSRFHVEGGDLIESLEDTIDLVAYQMKKSNVQIIKKFSDELPQITASWEHLKTVWLNLLINARDALKDKEWDERFIEIVARPAPTNDHVQVLFHDNGQGMREEQMIHIFEPFYTTKDPGKGTGLGLATCHRIIDQHGGEITVTSQFGRGTTFVIRLPVGEKNGADDDDDSLYEIGTESGELF